MALDIGHVMSKSYNKSANKSTTTIEKESQIIFRDLFLLGGILFGKNFKNQEPDLDESFQALIA